MLVYPYMLHVLTKNTKVSPTFDWQVLKTAILLIEKLLRLTERDHTHWKGPVFLPVIYSSYKTITPETSHSYNHADSSKMYVTTNQP